jgi:methyl-accepting chemotaxis protein
MNMKIKLKLVLIMIALGLISSAAIGITLIRSANINIRSLSHDKAFAQSREYANEIGNMLTGNWYTVKTSAHLMEQYEKIDLQMRRYIFNTFLKAILEEHPNVIAAWCAWEPNVLEGDDSLFIGTEGSDDKGRFVPYWHKDDGEIDLDLLLDIDKSSYYLTSMKSGQVAIIDPYFYQVGRDRLLITSITAPIINDTTGKTIGVIGVDIALNEIQKMTSESAPFNSDFSAVFSNNGTIVAHFDKNRIGFDMRKTE